MICLLVALVLVAQVVHHLQEETPLVAQVASSASLDLVALQAEQQ